MQNTILYTRGGVLAETVSVRLDSPDLKEIAIVSREWKTDRSNAVRQLLSRALKDFKKELALKELQEHKISIGLAAKKAGLNLWEMLDLIKEKNIDWTGYGKEDLEKDLKVLNNK